MSCSKENVKESFREPNQERIYIYLPQLGSGWIYDRTMLHADVRKIVLKF